MKKIIKKISPNFVFKIYYYLLAFLGAFIYDFPSNKMVVIGVTGTKGKTSTINFIYSTLMSGGYKTGIITTANIKIGQDEFLNKFHMTMPGRFAIQRLMSEMLKEGCKYCIVETTSEGIKQYRNIGIKYDIAVFTNLSPEHLPSHENSFEKYKMAKSELFKNLFLSEKVIDGKKIERVIIANKDSEHSDFFLNFNADKKITFGINNDADYIAKNIEENENGVSFDMENAEFENKNFYKEKLNENKFNIKILGKFNVYNALPAIIISHLAGISNSLIQKGLENLKVIPGRMEIINEGQNFKVIVDYAHEGKSMQALLESAEKLLKLDSKIIILLGAEGGGRDKVKRAVMGEICAKMADFIIVSNVDPYDDDPKEIINDIVISCEKFGKIKEQNLFAIEDRREGIRKAISLAKENDTVLITVKGAEQSMIIGKNKIHWDDRVVVREELKKLLKNKKST